MTRFNPIFGSGSSVGGIYAETGQHFEIPKQTCPRDILATFTSSSVKLRRAVSEKRSVVLSRFGHFGAVRIQWHGMRRMSELISFNPLELKDSYSATSNEVGTLAVDGWAVTFGLEAKMR